MTIYRVTVRYILGQYSNGWEKGVGTPQMHKIHKNRTAAFTNLRLNEMASMSYDCAIPVRERFLSARVPINHFTISKFALHCSTGPKYTAQCHNAVYRGPFLHQGQNRCGRAKVSLHWWQLQCSKYRHT